MKKKSPIKKEKLRRLPGQSLGDEIEKNIEDFLFWVMVPSLFFTITIIEFIIWYKEIRASPFTYLIIFLISLFIVIKKFFKTKTKIEKLRMARDGEIAVGQQLEFLREVGCRIFHDILGDNFNIDHIILSEKGVFIIETKTYSKPEKGESKIIYDGNNLIIDGYNQKDKIIKQANAQKNWLKETIKEVLDEEIDIKSIVVFPGWYIENKKLLSDMDVWVINPKALPKLIQKMPNKLTKNDIMKISYSISKFLS